VKRRNIAALATNALLLIFYIFAMLAVVGRLSPHLEAKWCFGIACGAAAILTEITIWVFRLPSWPE
jgi:hypothetical protein